jgi:hypothetical protein
MFGSEKSQNWTSLIKHRKKVKIACLCVGFSIQKFKKWEELGFFLHNSLIDFADFFPFSVFFYRTWT